MSELEQVSTAADAAAEAGAPTAGADPIDQLRDHIKRFVENANMSQHARMMALPKMDELIFWLRSGYGRG